MKAGLKKIKEGNLFTKLSRFLLSYRITPQSTTGVAPAELLMGRRLRTALDCIKPDLDRRVEKEQERQKKSHDQHSKRRAFNVGDMVYARNYRPGPKWVPAEVIKVTGSVSYKVKLLQDQMIWRRHQDQLRQCHVDRDTLAPSLWEDETSSLPLNSPVDSSSTSQTDSEPAESRAESSGAEPEKEQEPVTVQVTRAPTPARVYPQRSRRPPGRYGEHI